MPVVRKVTFIVWTVITLLVGAGLLLAPGRFLAIFSWEPVEPILDRIFGAGLLALSWLSWRGWRTSDGGVAVVVMETQAAFCALGAIGVLRHLSGAAHYPLPVWTVFVVLVVFAALWIALWATSRSRR